ELGWEPRTGVVAAVAETVEWLRRERRDLFEEDPPDLAKSRAYEECGRSVVIEPAGSENATELGETWPPPQPSRPSSPSTIELCVLAPLVRERDPSDRAALLGAAVEIARATGATRELC